MAPRTIYANLADGLQNLSLWDQSLADMGSLGLIPCTAAGSNAVTLTPIAAAFAPNITTPPQQLQNFTFVATATSTGSVTINGLKLYKEDGATQAAANDLLVNVLYGIVYNSALNSAAGGYQIAFPVTSIVSPVITGATISGSTITTSTYNGNTWTAGTGILTIAALKTLTANATLTLAGTDGTTMTFPATSATIARTDAGQTFTGTNAFGVLTATTVNGLAVTATGGGATINVGSGAVFTVTNTLTLSGTNGTTMTFPATSATMARTDAGNTFTGTQNLASLTISSAVATDGSKNLVSVTNTGSGNNVLATSPALTTPAIGAATGTSLALTGGDLSFATSGRGWVGTATNDSANAANVGEYIESVIVVGSAVALVSATPKTVTSISLTAGDWDVSANIGFNPAASTSATVLVASASLTTNTVDATNGRFSALLFPATVTAGTNWGLPLQPVRFSLSGTTTIFLVASSTFTVSTMGAYGLLRARRVR